MIILTLPGCIGPELDPDTVRDHGDIFAQAQAALARRQQAYPALVERGGMEPAAAQADIAAWQALVAEWRWICTGEGELPPRWTLFDRIEAVDLALERAAIALTRTPSNPELLRQRDLLQAMRWHLSRLNYGDQVTHVLIQITRQIRARVAMCGTCERRREDPAVATCTRTDCGLPKHPAHPEPVEGQERKAA